MKNVEYELDPVTKERTGGFRLSQFEPTMRYLAIPPSKRVPTPYVYPESR